MPENTLISQALAIAEAAKPVGPADSVPISPQQALVHAVYLEAKAVGQGHDTVEQLAKYTRAALAAGIPQHEIDAALAAARPDQ